MGYILNKDQQELVDLAKDFASKKVAPYVSLLDRADNLTPETDEGKMLIELYKQAVDIGFAVWKFQKNMVVWDKIIIL